MPVDTYLYGTRAIMKLFALGLVALLALPVPILAKAPASDTYRACLADALRPITGSSAYRNGSVREKRALLNGYNAEVTRLRAACRASR